MKYLFNAGTIGNVYRMTASLARHLCQTVVSHRYTSTMIVTSQKPSRFHKITFLSTVSVAILLALTACATSSDIRAPERYHYQFVHGQTALLQEDFARAPKRAPAAVHLATQAGNALQGMPYRYGGGHARVDDTGYDCSGTVSYVLNKAGLMKGTNTSRGFTTYGEPGPGKWITIYARDGHAFITIAGLRLDTGGGKNDTGPRWKPSSRRTSSFVLRHPPGF